jgi:hypothetical protein
MQETSALWILHPHPQASMLELQFLKEVDTRGDLYDREVVHRAVYRSVGLHLVYTALHWLRACRTKLVS